jgi:hypothetical protein
MPWNPLLRTMSNVWAEGTTYARTTPVPRYEAVVESYQRCLTGLTANPQTSCMTTPSMLSRSALVVLSSGGCGP